MTDLDGTRLERAIAPLAAAHRGESGVFPLADGRDAFAARVLLAQLAERTLDVQYYIWHNDKTGTLMFNALRDAAARGVLEHVAAGERVSLEATDVEALVTLYQRHIEREEKELLPMAARLLSDEDLDRVGRGMRERRGIHL